MNASNSSLGLNHSNNVNECATLRRGVKFTLGAVLLHTSVACALAFGVAGAAQAQKPAEKKEAPAQLKADPLAGDVWHAMGGTWPGTMVFNGSTKKVVLTPVGAEPLHASYVVSNVVVKGKGATGSLRMTNAAGQVVEASFSLTDAKNMNLRFAAGQRDETYVRMTPAEEEAEKARLVRMLEDKRKAADILKR